MVQDAAVLVILALLALLLWVAALGSFGLLLYVVLTYGRKR